MHYCHHIYKVFVFSVIAEKVLLGSEPQHLPKIAGLRDPHAPG